MARLQDANPQNVSGGHERLFGIPELRPLHYVMILHNINMMVSKTENNASSYFISFLVFFH